MGKFIKICLRTKIKKYSGFKSWVSNPKIGYNGELFKISYLSGEQVSSLVDI
jgi:hypothetical protein